MVGVVAFGLAVAIVFGASNFFGSLADSESKGSGTLRWKYDKRLSLDDLPGPSGDTDALGASGSTGSGAIGPSGDLGSSATSTTVDSGGSGTSTTISASTSEPYRAGASTGSLNFDGLDRTYRLYRGEGLPASDERTLVVMLHGGLGDGAGAARQGNWDAAADAGGFIAVFPDGYRRTWNAGGCCGAAMRDGVDDIGFIDALLDSLIETEGIDPERIFITGMSNGAVMSYWFACSASARHTPAAIAPVSGTLFGECTPTAPMSLLHIHGLLDDNLPFEGGVGSDAVTNTDWPPVRPGIERWRAAIGCPGTSTLDGTSEDRVVAEIWAPCSAGTEVQLITIADGRHAWPGGVQMDERLDAPSDALDATAVIWEFFASH